MKVSESVQWHDLRAPQLRELARQDAIVIVPVGSTEQHGPHLPVQVDALLAGEVARRAALRIRTRTPVVVAPTVWCGLAEHHMSFGATITLDFSTFHAVLRCVCDSILRHGFQRIVLLNGHGGNIKALDVIVGELRRELDVVIVSTTYWLVTQVTQAYESILEQQQGVRHACEAETSMLLALKPELVDTEAMKTVEAPDASVRRTDGLYRWQGFDEMTDSGVIGTPSAATAEKGERLLEAAASGLEETLLAGDAWA